MNNSTYDIIIVGGGAAGLACAVRLTECGKNLKILIVEAGGRLGKKLAATGNGQGNISNTDMSAEHYFGGNVQLAARIACRDPYAGAALFDCLFTADDKGRIYPAGRQASALCDCFIRKLKGKCNILLSTKVTDIKPGYALTLSSGEKVNATYVVLCAGGKAQKQFNTDGSAYVLAENLGHKITRLYPSLVQLKTHTAYIKTLKGIRADCKVTAFSNGKRLKSVRGDVIFTEYGVSGNAVFSLSPCVTDKQEVELSLEFLPDIPAKTIEKNISLRIFNGCPNEELLSGTLHNQIGRAIIARADSAEPKAITSVLKNFTLTVTGSLGFDYAQVTKGGVAMEGITPELESVYSHGAFFAGEILDIDGDCGGYNLQWAFTSGMAVADAIIKRL